jgi:hypothetical protein
MKSFLIHDPKQLELFFGTGRCPTKAELKSQLDYVRSAQTKYVKALKLDKRFRNNKLKYLESRIILKQEEDTLEEMFNMVDKYQRTETGLPHPGIDKLNSAIHNMDVDSIHTCWDGHDCLNDKDIVWD